MYLLSISYLCVSCVLTEYIENSKSIYLNDKFIRLVKKANETVDTKSIVDRPLKRPINEVLNSLDTYNENTTQLEAQEFVNKYLYDPGYDVYTAELTEWRPKPRFIRQLKNPLIRRLSEALHNTWRDLYKGFKFNPEMVSSHLPMKNEFIVPGGRFREVYYWDTYWTIEGLLVCDLHNTVFKMLENFVDLINQFGFIPNGSRIYYLNRSQPPYFAQMIATFYNYISTSKILKRKERRTYRKFVLQTALPSLIKEHDYWMNNRSINIGAYTLNRYSVNTDKPRPESYFEDIDSASSCLNDDCKHQIYKDKASAAESGYDFSSRWFRDPLKIETIETSNIIPVDLNSVLYRCEEIISGLCKDIGDNNCSHKFMNLAKQREKAINSLLWSKTNKFWNDYNIERNEAQSNDFYISNLTPLCFGISPPIGTPQELIDCNKDYLFKYEGGTPISFIESNEQWDYPNLWPPTQHLTIMMLLKYNRQLGLDMARRFFNTIYQGWIKHGVFYEKYDVTRIGERGFGGEYEVQSGFGWTNGATLSIIKIFGDDLIF